MSLLHDDFHALGAGLHYVDTGGNGDGLAVGIGLAVGNYLTVGGADGHGLALEASNHDQVLAGGDSL